MLEKKCLQCNKIFQKPYNESRNNWENRHKFCSISCQNLFRRMEKPICLFCKINKVKRVGKIYCSINCFSKANSGKNNNKWKGSLINKICLICNKNFQVYKDRLDAKTCSLDCWKLLQKTEKHRQFRSEIQRSKIDKKLQTLTQTVNQFRDILRRCSKYRMWCERVMVRDNFTCQMCEKRGGKLCVDHIDPFIAILFRNKINSYESALNCKELWDIQNGQTLCYSCHYKTPTYGSQVWKTLST